MKTIRSKMEARKFWKEFRESRSNPRRIAFLLQDWDDPYNVGGMFRGADALGALELVLSEHTPAPPHPQVSVTSLGQHRRIPWRQFAKHEEAALVMKTDGYSLIAIEITGHSTSYAEFQYSAKVCLVLGNEKIGVYSNVLKHCDAAVLIPMAGKGRSMNVRVSAAVVGFHIAYATTTLNGGDG